MSLLQTCSDLYVLEKCRDRGSVFLCERSGADHALGFEAAHFARFQICHYDNFSADKLFRIVIFGQAGKDLPRLFLAEVDLESKKFVGLRNSLSDLYLADTKFTSPSRDLIIRASGDATALVASIRAAVTSLDPAVPVYEVTTMDALIGRTLARDRFTAVLLAAFAVVSLVLAGVGIYGVFAGDVAQRRKEIGIRVALGAPSGGVVAMVMRRALTRALIGVALGTAGALVAARAMASLLYGVGSADPASFVGVAVLLLVVAIAATLVPALRAARVSPLVAIRVD